MHEKHFMNKSFLLCLLFSISMIFAEEYHDQNISFSYGLFNVTGMGVIAGNAIANMLNSEDKTDVDLLTESSFNFAYGYELFEKLEIGGILTYSYVGSGINYNTITLMPKLKFNWNNGSSFRFYSLLAVGPAFIFNSKKFKTTTLFQGSLLGFEFGKDTSFFFELGIGQAGMLVFGVKRTL